MEYNKVEQCTRRDEPSQRNILFKEKTDNCNLSKVTESKILSVLECTRAINIETKRELKVNKEELKKYDCNQISSETVKEANFEYEEEWDIGGIPELLSELDADIENSLKANEPSYEGVETTKNKQNFFKTLPQKNCIFDKKLKYVHTTESDSSLNFCSFEKGLRKDISTSKFKGFSKGGHLISDSINSNSSCSLASYINVTQQVKQNKPSCPVSMSSQAGNSSNTSTIVSGTINTTLHGNSSSSSGTKSNNKMSIDHQATLDKGLKMKIKRTKPGTKSSEAKHEIVKASEQQQIALVGGNICSTNQEDVGCLPSNQSTSSNPQNSNVVLSNSPSSSNTSGNKKNMMSGIITSNNGNITLNTTTPSPNIVSQTLPQGTKRGSSGHRRDKAKEKSTHSTRTAIEKNSSDKETSDKSICHCSCADGTVSSCSNDSCNRKTENNSLLQRLPTKNEISLVPPGVFTPSSDAATSPAVPNILSDASVISAPASNQVVLSGVSSNLPSPSSKDISPSNGPNVKISSHIAAQLAAAAVSNNASNVSSNSPHAFQNTDIKTCLSSSQPQSVKPLAPCHQNSALVANQKATSVCTMGTEKLTYDNSESPPPKKVKHQTENVSISSSLNKEMVDICVGTSIGTITEPDCLGPCEPGTSVTLEGIVWHETEGGVLVVNVTWRGKTYVGTLLDCTRHDWAPPRFCDSPTEDLDARTPKGRGKRNRASTTPDLSNFTETRSSIYFSHSHVHSKLRNGSNKGGRVNSRGSVVTQLEKNCNSSLPSGSNGITPNYSPTALLPPRAEKRKSKEESPPPPPSMESEIAGSCATTAASTSVTSCYNTDLSQTQSLVNPITGLNVQISAKKGKSSSSPCALSPVLLECPENACSKKYKHVNGLRYHQSHAHGNTSQNDEDSVAEIEEHITPQPSPSPSTPPPSVTPNLSDVSINQTEVPSQSEAMPTSEECKNNIINSGANMCDQSGSAEKNLTALTVSALCEDIHTATASNTIISSNESVPIIKVYNEQPKQQLDVLENNKTCPKNIFSLETNKQTNIKSPAAKSGVLRYGQAESKNNKVCITMLSTSSNEKTLQSEFQESDESKKGLINIQELNTATVCAESVNNAEHLHENQQSLITSKTISENLNVAKPKKEKASLNNDNELEKSNACNVLSREDVQSPAYSDISEDSTPMNELDHVEKLDVSKNSNLVKKSLNINLTGSSSCSSNPTNISASLNSYGVYQFYQQQQFLVPPPIEQQQCPKSSLNGSSLNQNQAISEFSSKKHPFDLQSKTSLNQASPSQHNQENNRDTSRPISATAGQGTAEISNAALNGTNTLNATTASKPHPNFYAFNYVPTNYSFNVDHNFGSDSNITTSEDITKTSSAQPELAVPTEEQHTTALYKDGNSKDEINSPDTIKSPNHQITPKHIAKCDAMGKADLIKQEPICSQISHLSQHTQSQSKENQVVGAYANMYQRHPIAVSPSQLTREDELRRYYIFSDQQRRQSSSSHNASNHPIQSVSGSLCKEDSSSSLQASIQNQAQMKIKGNISAGISKSPMGSIALKESVKQKQEEEMKAIKQEGQKPTMETQGPPPPPTSQYFLHPSFITSSPFAFDPGHPMYRNVLMPTTSPYNAPSYHLPMPRFHAPEDLSRNTSTKALDALHHAASQYYTTHKIHELSERALKSPSNTNTSNVSGTIKSSSSSPNIVSNQQSNVVNHSSQNLSSSVNQITSQTLNLASKLELSGQKPLINAQVVSGNNPIEPQKTQSTLDAVSSSCNSGNVSNNPCINLNGGTGPDSRSPPPQRHVHTHHHTHVGLGYPMYPAPYGAAVLASQQAAAVAVINPFPSGPNK